MARLHVLRVFTNEEGEWGNHLGVFLDGREVPESARQAVAGDLGFSETVFVDDAFSGEVRIFTPEVELPFAGHPLVGTGWLLDHEATAPPALRPPAGEVDLRVAGGMSRIVARPEWAPPFEPIELAGPAEVHALTAAPGGGEQVYAWAWIDEAAGTIRARSFVPAYGIAEDEATGSAALMLCGLLERRITIHQGHGSVLLARPLEDGRVEVAGTVAFDEVREYPLA